MPLPRCLRAQRTGSSGADAPRACQGHKLCPRVAARAAPRQQPPQQQREPAQDVIALLEEAAQAEAAGAPRADPAATAPAAAPGADPKEPLYKALLAIVLKLAQPAEPQQQPAPEPQQQPADEQQRQRFGAEQARARLEAFLRSQPAATSIPFISWLADLEAAASGAPRLARRAPRAARRRRTRARARSRRGRPAGARAGARKAQLAALCEALLLAREAADAEGQEALYADTLRLLSRGREESAALMAAQPAAYALALAEGLTGAPAALRGYGPALDLLLQAAPPAALTPEGVAQGHAAAAELAADLSGRRRSTLAAMMGRTRVTPEQQAALMAGSPASRIADLLLTLPSGAERLALLPDCFTPPPPPGRGGDAAAAAQQPGGGGGEEETEELWCTPAQLLNELDARLKAAAAAAPDGRGAPPRGALGPASSSNSSSGPAGEQARQRALPPGAPPAPARAA
ncbi:hypothetical protein HT031_005587 [Scenedesmus sp. PABB004]|nr:hypothetical protein HT031_005587 [Scenedesmus sp. PABB004]